MADTDPTSESKQRPGEQLVSFPFELSLRPVMGNAASVGELGAVFLPGRSAASWLDEITGWSDQTTVDQQALRLHPLQTGGVLVAGIGIESARALDLKTPGAMKLRRAHTKVDLWIPTGSRLAIPIDQSEAFDVTGDGNIAMLLPPDRLIVLEAARGLSLGDLVDFPPTSGSNWGYADPGIQLRSTITAIDVTLPPDLGQLLAQGSDDIGTDPLDGKEGINGPVEWLKHKATSMFTNSSRQEVSVRWLEKLFETNPDEALRRAIPLDGGPAGRGIAAFGSWLGRRANIDFNLGSLGGGGAAGSVGISGDAYESLRQRYRDAANRELRLGRHRRAAFIFATLLHDLHGAADALSQGGFHREAAAIYKGKLHNTRRAAECLEKAGAWDDALEIYLELKDYAAMGRLNRTIGRDADADAAFELLAQSHRTSGQFLAAGRVLHDELNDPEAADAEWRGAWSQGRGDYQACLDELLDRAIAADLDPEEESTGRFAPELVRWAHSHASANCQIDLAGILGKRVGKHPAPGFVAVSHETVLRISNEQLPTLGIQSTGRLLAAMRAVDPCDQLLGQETFRYQQTRQSEIDRDRANAAKRHRPRRRAAEATGTISLVTEITIAEPPNKILGSVALAEAFCVLGISGKKLVLRRISLTGAVEAGRLEWDTGTTIPESAILSGWVTGGQETVIAHLPGVDPENKELQSSDGTRTRARFLQAPNTLALSCTQRGSLWSVRLGSDGGFQLDGYDRSLQLLESTTPDGLPDIPRETLFSEAGSVQVPTSSTIQDTDFWFGIGRLLHLHPGRGFGMTLQLEDWINDLAATMAHSAPRVAVACYSSVLLVNDQGEESLVTDEVEKPLIAFTRGGDLVIASGNEVTCYSTDRDLNTTFTARIELPDELRDPIRVAAAPGLRRFSVLGSSGADVGIFEIE